MPVQSDDIIIKTDFMIKFLTVNEGVSCLLDKTKKINNIINIITIFSMYFTFLLAIPSLENRFVSTTVTFQRDMKVEK